MTGIMYFSFTPYGVLGQKSNQKKGRSTRSKEKQRQSVRLPTMPLLVATIYLHKGIEAIY